MLKCEICEKEFKNKAGLAGHMRNAHPDSVVVPSAELLSAMKRTEEHLDQVLDQVLQVRNQVSDQAERIGKLVSSAIQGLNEIAGAVIKRDDLEQLVTNAVHGSNPGQPEPEPNPEPKSAKRPPIGSIFKQS